MEDVIYLQEIQYQRDEWENSYVCREPAADRVDVQQEVHQNVPKRCVIKLSRATGKDSRRSKSNQRLREPVLL